MDGRFSGGEGEIISPPMSSEHGEAAASVQHGICKLPSPGRWRIGHGKKRNHQHQYQHYLLSCSSGGRLKVTSPWGGAMGPSRSTRGQHGVVNVILGKRKRKLDVKPHPLQYLMRRVRERGEEKREYFRTIVHIVGSHSAVSCEHGCMIDSSLQVGRDYSVAPRRQNPIIIRGHRRSFFRLDFVAVLSLSLASPYSYPIISVLFITHAHTNIPIPIHILPDHTVTGCPDPSVIRGNALRTYCYTYASRVRGEGGPT
jgi:hypothetical protein